MRILTARSCDGPGFSERRCSRYHLDFIFLRRRCLLPPLLRASSRHFISPASAPRFLWGHPRVKYRRMSIIVRIWQPAAATAPVLCGGPCYRSCSAHVYGTADVPSFIYFLTFGRPPSFIFPGIVLTYMSVYVGDISMSPHIHRKKLSFLI